MKNTRRNVVLSWMGMMSLVGTAWANSDRPIWDYSAFVELTIDRPAKDVWPYFFGEKEEMWSTHYTHIAGEAGKVGELYRNAEPFLGGDVFYEAIKVTPEKQLVLKITYKEKAKNERKLVGYDLITLKEVAGHTTVVLAQAFALPFDPKIDLRQETAKQDKNLADIFQKLKRLVESSQ